MSTRTLIGGSLSALVAILVIVAAAGCGSPSGSVSSDGPVQLASSGGQPSLSNASIVSVLGVPADGMVSVVNKSSSPVRITSVSAVPAPAASIPVLAHAGIGTTGREVAADYGWPVAGVPTVPAVGGRLQPGQSNIIFGLTGTKLGRYYAIAGLKIAYSYQGRKYALVAWSGFTTCFTAALTRASGPAAQCGKKNQVSDAVNQYIEKMAW